MLFLYSHLKKLKLEQKNRLNPHTRKQLMIIAEISELETRSTVEQINRTRSWFFERINKINKPLARLIQKTRESTEINKIMNEKGEVTTNINEIGGIITNFKNSYMPIN